MQYAVGDGLSIGRPCCAVHDCKVNLTSKRDIYCPEHAYLAQQCAIIGCELPRVPPTQTCTLEAHQAVERAYRSDANRAIHKLRARLRNNGVSVPGEPTAAEEMDDEVLVSCAQRPDDTTVVLCASATCDEKPSGTDITGIKGRFGRRRTHNEQAIMRPCGVYLSRATLFGSEALSGVKVRVRNHSGLRSGTAHLYLGTLQGCVSYGTVSARDLHL